MNTLQTRNLLIAIVSLFAVWACEPIQSSMESDQQLFENLTSIENQFIDPSTIAYCGDAKTVDLIAGQTIDAGDVTIYNDAEYLYVSVTATTGFQQVSENLKLWLGTDLALLPRANSGAPINGQFPYKATVTDGNSYTFQVLLSDIPTYDANTCGKQEIFVVFHVDVLAQNEDGSISAETAYSGDIEGDGNRWWFYTGYVPACCDQKPPVTGVLETAFVKFDKNGDFGTGYVFTSGRKSNPERYASLDLTRNRWGWAGNVTADGSYTFDVWAGSGLNDTDRGTLVGTATITVTGDQVTVSYNMSGGYSMQEVHIYAGDTAPETIAPGQYGYISYFGDEPADYATSHTATFTVADTDGDGIWIIAHAVAYGEM